MKKKARSKTSRHWLNRHFRDEYVKQAMQQGLRSRAVFKLTEIDDRDQLFEAGMKVIDLGAAPGGWSQHVAKKVGISGKLIALDILSMEEIPGVSFIQGDFRETDVLEKLNQALAGEKVEVVLSDMAPKMSGIPVTDQARAIYLAELALEFAKDILKPGGVFLVKLFQGSEFNKFHKKAQRFFDKVVLRKPKASRAQSREIYLLAKGFKFSQ